MARYIWNSLPVSLKATKGLNTYKRWMKKHFLDRMKNNESNIYSYFQLLFVISCYYRFCYYLCYICYYNYLYYYYYYYLLFIYLLLLLILLLLSLFTIDIIIVFIIVITRNTFTIAPEQAFFKIGISIQLGFIFAFVFLKRPQWK